MRRECGEDRPKLGAKRIRMNWKNFLAVRIGSEQECGTAIKPQ